jgi:hypothetical protein
MKNLKIFSILALIAIVFAACQKDQFRNVIGGADNAKKISGVVWNSEIDKPFAVNIDAVKSARTNASGEKIPSNAHSAKFSGIYFIWDAKQKDPGYLKVDAKMFDTYESFVLTAKNANLYWDYKIQPQVGQEQTPDNCYVFYIPKIEKNINMVFFTDWVAKECEDCLQPPVLITVPVTPIKYPCEEIIYITSSKFDITGKPIEVDPEGKWKMPTSSDDIKTQWNKGIAGIEVLTNMNAPEGLKPTWIWDREFSWETGFTGSQIIVYTQKFDINGEIFEDEIPLYFACDNAAVIFVNDKKVAWTTEAFKDGREVPEAAEEGFKGLGHEHFDGSVWNKLYEVDIRPYLVEGEENTIQILAANSANEPDPNSPNHQWDIHNNPAGIIFGAVFTVLKMTPECTGVLAGATVFEKWKREQGKEDELASPFDGFDFRLYSIDEVTGKLCAGDIHFLEVDFSGVVTVGDLPVGKYVIKEEKHAEWEILLPAGKDGIYFEIVRGQDEIDVIWEDFDFFGLSELGNLKVVNNKVIKDVPLGPRYSSVTATNDAGNPFIVPNSNHFTYAVLNRADLEAGRVILDMVEGNKINKVGEVEVSLQNGKLCIVLDGVGTFGATASATLFNPSNGNVHSGNSFKHNNEAVIDCPSGDVIYLYIHGNPFSFYQR